MGLILVVDDNVDIGEILEVLLVGEGHRVEVRHSGPEALAYCATTVPDLVLLDVALPGLDGLAVLRRLRDEPRLAVVPVVLLTARAHPDDIDAGRAAGATDYLVKPFEAQELLATVAQALG